MKRAISAAVLLTVLTLVSLYLIGARPNFTEDTYYKIKIYPKGTTFSVPDTFRVMTYNVGYLSGMTNNRPVERSYELLATNLRQLISLIESTNPHVVAFQEIDFGSSRTYDQQQLDSVALALGYPNAYQSVNWDKTYVPFPYWPPTQHFGQVLSGQAILSRPPLRADTTIKLSQPINSPFWYRAFYIDRLIQITDVQVGDQTVKVLNVHLEAFDEPTRVEHARVVKQVYEQYASKMPVILMGDFNSRPPGEENGLAMEIILQAENIASAIQDSLYQLNPKAFYTFDSQEPYQMIDYILFNPTFIQPISARVAQEAGEISDHLPVVLDFVLKSQNAD